MKNNLIRPSSPNMNIGGKANNLIVLDQMNLNVPQWVVIPQSVLLAQIPEDVNDETVLSVFDALQVPEGLLNEMNLFFGQAYRNKKYAVRSSAIDEDGTQFSFAGQYSTLLNVAYENLEESVLQIWKSVISENIRAYRNQNKLDFNYGIAVIIQEMIDPDVSGVAFGMNPLNGDHNSKIVSAVYGLGEGLVSGELNADNYKLNPSEIVKDIAKKQFTYNCLSNDGIKKKRLERELQSSSTLDENQLVEIEQLLDALNEKLGSPQDIEFAYTDDKLFVLQTRPITTTGDSSNQDYMLWDNSNIVESYPGITTPLTFSFISKMYAGVYRQLFGLMGVSKKVITANDNVFTNTLGLVRGRVYYNLVNWYKMLAMAPGYSINAKFMETMMGVKEKFELGDQFKMSKHVAWFRTVIMIVKMFFLQIRLPKQRKAFQKILDNTLEEYKHIDFDACSSTDIIQHYKDLENNLLGKWNAPLVNDFFSMIWFGILKKMCEESFPEELNMHNDLLCGSQDIISVMPIRETLAIANMITNDPYAKRLFLENSPEEMWKKLEEVCLISVKFEIDKYLERFGERCIGELKLETISYNQNPVLFIHILKDYVVYNVADKLRDSNIENELRSNAELKLNTFLKGKFIKKWWFNYVLKKARDLISNRENLRFERTRAFGMVRRIFSALGKRLESDGLIKNDRDVFYLELDELVALKETLEFYIKESIAKRKSEFSAFHDQDIPEERFYTYGLDFSDEYIYSKAKMETVEGDLKGIGCCPGLIKAKVRIVNHPSEVSSLNGDILVTSSTDPGWVTLFPSASGIIVERGSLLSHSAIVSREMGIPCIVSVDGLLRSLKTGDEVLMDGRSGEIKILNQ